MQNYDLGDLIIDLPATLADGDLGIDSEPTLDGGLRFWMTGAFGYVTVSLDGYAIRIKAMNLRGRTESSATLEGSFVHPELVGGIVREYLTGLADQDGE